MPGETMTDEGYGVLGVSWTLTHDLTHVGCTDMADKGEVAEVVFGKRFLCQNFLYCIVSRCVPMFMRGMLVDF